MWRFFLLVGQRILKENIFTHAAALAYITLLSLIPLTIIGVAIFSAFPEFHGIQQKVQQFVLNNFVASSAQTIQQHLQIFVNQAINLSASNIFFLLTTAILMVFSMEQSFNKIWGAQKHRNLIQALFMYLAVLIFTPIILGAGLLISAQIMNLKMVSFAVNLPIIKPIILGISPLVCTFIAFVLLYITVPNCKVKFVHACFGSLVASILFEMARYGFSFYITNLSFYTFLYGTFASISIFLIWLYLSWLIVLLGAVATHTVSLEKST